MAIEILMPALSPTMEEGKLAKWLVKVGDAVKSGQVIAEIETDKATMEVEAVDEGVVLELLTAEGAEGVRVNSVIARLAGEGEPPAKTNAVPAKGAGPRPDSTAARTAPAAATPAGTLSAVPGAMAAAPGAMAAAPGTMPGGTKPGGERVAASPLARRIAQMLGIDLSGIAGSGPNGRVVKKDLEGARPGGSASRALTPMPQGALVETRIARTLAELGYDPASYELKPIDSMRRTIARRLTESFRDVPHFPLNIDLDIDALLTLRKDVNAALEADKVKISVNDFIIRACAMALKRAPAANASFTPEGIAYHRHADIAVAVAIEGGLITPIIKAAETKSVREISGEMADLAARARARKLKPHEFQGGTFSLSNLGMMGIKSFASILNEPQGCILSVGAGEQRPVVKNGALAVATMMSVTLTCDHRVVDGAIGAEFLGELKALIEKPLGLVA